MSVLAAEPILKLRTSTPNRTATTTKAAARLASAISPTTTGVHREAPTEDVSEVGTLTPHNRLWLSAYSKQLFDEFEAWLLAQTAAPADDIAQVTLLDDGTTVLRCYQRDSEGRRSEPTFEVTIPTPPIVERALLAMRGPRSR